MSDCPTGKKLFAKKSWARDYVKRRPLFRNQRPYRCPECGLWHLTSADARSRFYIRENK